MFRVRPKKQLGNDQPVHVTLPKCVVDAVRDKIVMQSSIEEGAVAYLLGRPYKEWGWVIIDPDHDR